MNYTRAQEIIDTYNKAGRKKERNRTSHKWGRETEKLNAA
jgi:hypothetical protein